MSLVGKGCEYWSWHCCIHPDRDEVLMECKAENCPKFSQELKETIKRDLERKKKNE